MSGCYFQKGLFIHFRVLGVFFYILSKIDRSEVQIDGIWYLIYMIYKNDTTSPEVYKQAFFFFVEITSRHQNYVQIFTDGLKVDEKVAAAAVLSVAQNSPFSCRLRDHCSIYTAELQAVLFALSL